ncbi:MAG: GAF domain-containing protein [Anaerolineales bacterium]|nr:GAF domain-containing protein [Anaerolineales bacterium]
MIPRKLCKSAERLLGVGEVYIAGFGLETNSTGGLVLFIKQGSQVNHPAAIETIVNHFAVIFERRQVQKEIIQRKAQLEALRDIELDIKSQLNLEELLVSIAEKASLIVNATASGFYILNPDRDVLEYIAYTGFDKLPEVTELRIGEGLSGKVWEKQETIIVDNYAEWEGRSQNWVSMGNYYLAGIPVCWGDELLGVLEIALDPSETLSKSDIEMLELFAAQAAIAIQNARLFSGEKQRRQESETLREVGMLINRMMDRPELLELTLVALQKVVPYHSASVQLVRGGEIVVEAFRGIDHPERVIGTSYNIKDNKLAHPILYEGKKIILENGLDCQEQLKGPNIEKVQSWLAVPLEVKGARIGLIALDHYEPGQYTELDAELVQAFANQAAIAIENNRLFEEIQRHTREMKVVYESALNMTQELHPDALFEYLHQQAETLFAPDAFMLATIDPTSEMIQVSFASEAGIRQTQVEGMQISPDEKNSLLSWIIRKKTPLLIGNVETDSLPVQPRQNGEIIHSWLGVPLLVGDRLIGALVVQSYQVEAYDHDHRRLLQLLGNQAAIALENSRLFEEAQRRLSRISSLWEIDLAISGSIDLQITMEVLISQLIQTLGVDAACVLLYKPHTQSLEYVSASGFRTDSLKHTALRLGDGLAGKAALERTMVHIPDLTSQSTSLQRAPLFNQEGFITYLANPLIAKGELVGVLEVFNRNRLDPDQEWLNFLDAIARLAAIAIDRLNLFNELEKSNVELVQAYDATIEGWARAIELRDGDTEGHSRRVVRLALNLAQKMGVAGEALIHIRRGAQLHDIGKMAIPDGILLKTGKLTDEEWLIMKKHPVYAYEMLSSIQYLIPALDIPYCHHEWWDGSGYPRELSGERIPLAARIFAVVDVWDALQSDRPYRDAWSEAKAAEYIKKLSGTQFDPQVTEAFFDMIDLS